MKKKILYYSDCSFFAGCENMIANFLNSEELKEMFDIFFLYHYTARYEVGLKGRVNNLSICEGIKLVTEPAISCYVTSSHKLVRLFQKLLWAVSVLLFKYWALYRNTKILKKEFAKHLPDIVHVNNGGYPAAISAQSAVLAAHICGVKDIYYVVNNMAVGYASPFRWLDFFVDFFVKKYVTKFITGSDNAGNHLKKTLSLNGLKQCTIHNGIIQRKTTMTVEDFKKIYGIPNGKIVFSTIANLDDRKGHRYLLQAIKELKEENLVENAIFILEGKGDNEEFIKKYIADNQIGDLVKLISVNAIYNLYAVTDVTILPSIANEDFPNVIIESMGMGIPVIGTRIAGIPEQILPDTGILVQPQNVYQLKDAIRKMITDAKYRIDCGKKAKEVFLENYTAEKSIKHYIELYNQ